jgi:hypothetical protein
MDIIVQVWRYENIENCPRKQQRQREIEFCIRTHFRNPNIRTVHLLGTQEDETYFKTLFPGAKYHVVPHQPTYGMIFNYVNTLTPHTVVCICNTDIEIGSFNPAILNRVNNQVLLALTRHNVFDGREDDYQIRNYGGSHDAFITQVPLTRISYNRLNFKQNVFGAENVLMFEFKSVGYTLKNPCRQLPIYHHHKDETYFEQYTRINHDKNTAVCPPSDLGTYDEGHRIHPDSP